MSIVSLIYRSSHTCRACQVSPAPGGSAAAADAVLRSVASSPEMSAAYEHMIPVPRVASKVTDCDAGLAEDYAFARAYAPAHVEVKATCCGPHTLSAFVQNDYYPSQEALAMDIAAALNAE